MSTKTQYKSYGIIPGGPWHTRYYRVSDNALIFEQAGTQADMSAGYESSSITTTKFPNTPVRECLHESFSKRVFSCPIQTYYNGYGVNRLEVSGTLQYPAPMSRGVPGLTRDNLSIVYPKTVDTLLQEARQAFYDVNETDNLLNILEVGQTLNSIASMGQLLTRLRTSFKDLRAQKTLKVSLRKFSHSDVSNMFLAWSFGFAPLIADARKIARALPRIRGNLRALAKRSARPISAVRSCDGTMSLSLAGLTDHWVSGDTPDIFHWWSEAFSHVSAPRRVAGVHGVRSIEYKTDGFQEIDYLLSRFIATGPISLAWEKVKFSFAVDWFINLTGVIDRLDNVLTGHRKQIKYAWSSESYNSMLSVISHGFTETIFPGWDGSEIGRYSFRYYHRKPETVDNNISWSGRFGKKQTALSVALISQMAANLRRKR